MGARARAGSGRRGSALGRSLPRQPAVGPVPRSAQQRQRRAVACVAIAVRGVELLIDAQARRYAGHGARLVAGAGLQPALIGRARATLWVLPAPCVAVRIRRRHKR